MVITDGKSTHSHELTVPTAHLAQSQGIRMLAVGISAEIDPDELRDISSLPRIENNTYWLTPDFKALNKVLPQVMNATCTPNNIINNTGNTFLKRGHI